MLRMINRGDDQRCIRWEGEYRYYRRCLVAVGVRRQFGRRTKHYVMRALRHQPCMLNGVGGISHQQLHLPSKLSL